MAEPRDSGRSKPEAPSRDELLGEAAPVARRVFELVRAVLDDLEAAAPWKDLHLPPESMEGLLSILGALLDVLDSVPDRFVDMQARLTNLGDGSAGGQDLVDARFYFEGIHSMVAEEIEDLRRSIEPLQKVPLELIALPPDRKAFLCQITADLKGKYASALMGASAALVAGEVRHPVEIEPLLFDEKAEEFRRNRRLVKTLVDLLDRLRKLATDVEWEKNVRAWTSGEPLDPYALRPVVGFVDVLGKLLEGEVRRALYSGDYHEIGERRRALTSRVNALSTLLLMEAGVRHDDDTKGQRRLMVRRAAEIAALLDREVLLPLVIGDKAVSRMEEWARLQESGQEPEAPPALDFLLPLVVDEDLESFLKRLLRSVLKRGSLILERRKRRAAERRAGKDRSPAGKDDPGSAPPSASTIEVTPEQAAQARQRPPDATRPDATRPDAARPDAARPDAARPSAARPSAARPSAARPSAARPSAAPRTSVPAAGTDRTSDRPADGPPVEPPPEAAPPAVPPASPAEREALRRELVSLLAELRSPEDARRKPFDFLHRMIQRRAAIPSGMVRAMHPFLDELRAEVLPPLSRLAAGGVLPKTSAEQLRRSLDALGDPSPPPAWIQMEMGPAMSRLAQFLDALASSVEPSP